MALEVDALAGVYAKKQKIRRHQVSMRKRLSHGEHAQLSSAVQQRVLAMPEFIEATTIGLYSPIGNEVGTELLLDSGRQRDAVIAFPRVSGDDLSFVRADIGCRWRCGSFGIDEPAGDTLTECSTIVAPEHLDLVVVPGVAFDHFGYRLGYGKGFYDRYLVQCAPKSVFVGLSYAFQLLEELPHEKHDVCMHYIATENGVSSRWDTGATA